MEPVRKRRHDAGDSIENQAIPTKVLNVSADTVSIAIVGGGIAGLSTALALQRRGFNVTVYERDPAFSDRRQGYGLTLVNNPKGPLAELGLLERCINEDCPSNAHWLFRPEGTILGYYGRSFKQPPSSSTEGGASSSSSPSSSSSSSSTNGTGRTSGDTFEGNPGGTTGDTPGGNPRGTGGTATAACNKVEGRGNLRIPRQNLRKMMMELLLPGTVQWGMKIVDYEEHDSHVSIQFQRQRSQNESQTQTQTQTQAQTQTQTQTQTQPQTQAQPQSPSPTNSTSEHEGDDVVTVKADVLVGADGIRSIVRQLRAQKPGRMLSGTGSTSGKPVGEGSPLHYTTIAVILGITTASHPLITQQGFYCLDGTHRLFTMPFEEEGGSSSSNNSSSSSSSSSTGNSDSNSDSNTETTSKNSSSNNSSSNDSNEQQNRNETRLTMWQLSFSGLSEDQAALLKGSSPSDLLAEARRRTAGWFAPVQAMIDGTPVGEVWGTGLYDRDPMVLWGRDRGSRVTVVGDACHPMSMFKGQGTNQALQDGPLLASWLQRDGTVATSRNIYTRLKCFEREMVARTSGKVQASRDAAVHLHSPAVFDDECGVDGVPPGLMKEVFGRLRERGVGAGRGEALVDEVREVIAAVEAEHRGCGGAADSNGQ